MSVKETPDIRDHIVTDLYRNTALTMFDKVPEGLVDHIEKIANPTYLNYLVVRDLRDDERSMSYIARKLGFKQPSSVQYLLDKYEPGRTKRSAL